MTAIYVGSPWPNDTLERSFMVTGSVTLDTPVGCSVVVTVKDSSGGTIASATLNYTSSSGTLIPWMASFAVGQDYFDCSIRAELRIGGSNPSDPPFSDGAEGIDIEQDQGGMFMMP